VPTQQITSIAKPFQENVATTILFYTPLANTTKAVFGDNVCELYKVLISKLKAQKFVHLVFSLQHPYQIKMARD